LSQPTQLNKRNYVLEQTHIHFYVNILTTKN
jgi:hypothetical protein